MLLNTLKSNKGAFLILFTYPVLILLMAFGFMTFASSINANNQTRQLLRSTQAQYEAYKGIEYAFIEIKNKTFSTTQFLTHSVGFNNTLVSNVTANPHITTSDLTVTGCSDVASTYCPKIESDGTYTFYRDASHNNGFEVRTYKLGNDFYILTKGIHDGKTRLFVDKIVTTSLYNYFSFYPGNIILGYQAFDAGGSKIHTNGDFLMTIGLVMSNVKTLSSAGKMAINLTYREISPGDENAYSSRRWPFWAPNNYSYANPPPDNNADGVGDNNIGNYSNYPDVHIPGDQWGLFMENPATPAIDFVRWDASPTNLGGSASPIPSSPTVQIPGTAVPGAPTAWGSADYSYIYQQEDVTCAATNTCASADGFTNNDRFHHQMPKINGTFIPNRMGANYQTYRYEGHATGDMMITNATDSSKNLTAWNTFLDHFPMGYDPANPTVVTGLKDVVKASDKYIAPPKINMTEFIAKTKSSNQGIAIEPSTTTPNTLQITINGGDSNGGKTISLAEGASVGCDASHNVYTQKTFINHMSGLTNKVVEVDVGNMIFCEGQPSQLGKWKSKSGILYSNYGLALANAKKLPAGGLTSVVAGNLLIKAPYNHPDSSSDWQPSAAVVSNYSYLVSSDFPYPTTLGYTYHHPDFPYSYTDGS